MKLLNQRAQLLRVWYCRTEKHQNKGIGARQSDFAASRDQHIALVKEASNSSVGCSKFDVTTRSYFSSKFDVNSAFSN